MVVALPYYALLTFSVAFFFANLIKISSSVKSKLKDIEDKLLKDLHKIKRINVDGVIFIYEAHSKFKSRKNKTLDYLKYIYYGNLGMLGSSLLGSGLIYYSINSDTLFSLSFLVFIFSTEFFGIAIVSIIKWYFID